MSNFKPIRSLADVQQYITSKLIAPYQNVAIMYGALRVFFDFETLDSANLTPYQPPLRIRMMIPPKPSKDATEEQIQEYKDKLKRLEDNEEYQSVMSRVYTCEDFIEWLTTPDE